MALAGLAHTQAPLPGRPAAPYGPDDKLGAFAAQRIPWRRRHQMCRFTVQA